MSRPPRPPADPFEAALSSDDVDTLWLSLDIARRRVEFRRLLVRVAAVSVLAGLVSAVGFFSWHRRTNDALRLAAGSTVAATGAALDAFPVRFDDDSHIDALPGDPSLLRVLENVPGAFTTQLVSGHVRFSVTPGGPRRWVVWTDIATVEVVGTVFELDRHAGGLRVSVDHGVVLVRGERVPDRMRQLRAGESIDLPVPAEVPATPPASAHGSPGADPEPAPPPPTVPPSVTAPDSGRSLDAFLDEVESMRRTGRRPQAREALQRRASTAREPAERATLLVTLAQWTAEDGDDATAATLLAGLRTQGVPSELVETAWRLESACLRRAGRPNDAAAVEHRLEERFPAAGNPQGKSQGATTP